MKTYELTGVSLDWAVAKCEGKAFAEEGEKFKLAYSPSTVWAQGGPIIERERLELATLDDEFDKDKWASYTEDGRTAMYGTEPLLAAMRCYVASKLGYTVEVPAELLE